MCNATDCNHGFQGFADMDEDLGASTPTPAAAKGENFFGHTRSTARGAPTAVYEEQCKKCRGRGRFIGYTGRDLGPCFACTGAGKLMFKTPTEVRERARERTVERARSVEMQRVERAHQWYAAHPVQFAWMKAAAARNFDFAQSLIDAVEKFGSLTDNQLAAVDRCIERDNARNAERAAASTAAAADPAALDLSSIPSGFYAVPEGETRLKLRIRNVKDGKWAGWTFVDDGAAYGQGQKYGSQRPGARYAGKCVDALRAILAGPRAASAAYGQLVGSCGVCGRKLEDAESVARGIGPVCASKFS